MTTLHRAASRRRWAALLLQLVIIGSIWSGALALGLESRAEALTCGFLAAAVTTVLLARRSDSHRVIRSFTQDIDDVIVATLAGAGAAMVAASAAGRLLPLLGVAGASVASIVTLLLVRSVAARSATMQRSTRRLVIIGTGEEGAELTQLVLEHPEASLELIGVVGDRATAERSGLLDHWLGQVDDLATVFADHQIDVAIVTPTSFRSPQYRRILGRAEHAQVDVLLSSGVARIAAPRVQIASLVHEPLVSIQWDRPSRGQAVARRAMDLVGASIGLIIAAPIMLAAALAIKLADRGPIFYRSGRVGLDDQPFGMIKFRSMRPDADLRKNDLAQRNERSGPLFKISNDPRVTPVGRILRETSIDELPQLLNVLRGEMSLVGPRPALPEEYERFDDELRARFDVRPGITGLWQVEARSNAEFGAYRRLDLHYVSNWSLWLDIQIMVATVVQILTSLVMLPISLVTRGGINDQIASQTVAPVIDLRTGADETTAVRPGSASSADQPPKAFSTGN